MYEPWQLNDFGADALVCEDAPTLQATKDAANIDVINNLINIQWPLAPKRTLSAVGTLF